MDGLTYVPISDIGMEREENQDYQGHDYTPHGYLFVVADGMGGHAGGATASQMAVNHIKRAMREVDIVDPNQALEYSVRYANQQIWRKSQVRPDLRGMGSTVVTLLLSGDMAWLAHVGDSRIYLLRGNKMMQLTKDHTMVQRLLDEGLLDEEAARHHPTSHVLSRSLGGLQDVYVELFEAPIRVQRGDIFLMCSDGLTGMLYDEEIATVLMDFEPHDAARVLVDEANARGGHDNTTISIVRIDEAPLRQFFDPTLATALSPITLPAMPGAKEHEALGEDQDEDVWGPPSEETEQPEERAEVRAEARAGDEAEPPPEEEPEQADSPKAQEEVAQEAASQEEDSQEEDSQEEDPQEEDSSPGGDSPEASLEPEEAQDVQEPLPPASDVDDVDSDAGDVDDAEGEEADREAGASDAEPGEGDQEDSSDGERAAVVSDGAGVDEDGSPQEEDVTAEEAPGEESGAAPAEEAPSEGGRGEGGGMSLRDHAVPERGWTFPDLPSILPQDEEDEEEDEGSLEGDVEEIWREIEDGVDAGPEADAGAVPAPEGEVPALEPPSEPEAPEAEPSAQVASKEEAEDSPEVVADAAPQSAEEDAEGGAREEGAQEGTEEDAAGDTEDVEGDAEEDGSDGTDDTDEDDEDDADDEDDEDGADDEEGADADDEDGEGDADDEDDADDAGEVAAPEPVRGAEEGGAEAATKPEPVSKPASEPAPAQLRPTYVVVEPIDAALVAYRIIEITSEDARVLPQKRQVEPKKLDVAQPSETLLGMQAPAPTPWTLVLVAGAAALAVGVLVGFIGGRGPADELRQQNNNLINTRVELQSELDNTNKTLDLARQSLFRLESEAKERDKALRGLEEERDTLVAEKQGLQKEVERLQQENQALQQPPEEEP